MISKIQGTESFIMVISQLMKIRTIITETFHITINRSEHFRTTIQFRVSSIHSYNQFCHTRSLSHRFQYGLSLLFYFPTKSIMPIIYHHTRVLNQRIQPIVRFGITLFNKMQYVIMLPTFLLLFSILFTCSLSWQPSINLPFK